MVQALRQPSTILTTLEILSNSLALEKIACAWPPFLPHESQPLKEFLADFCDDIQAMGKSPIIHRPSEKNKLFLMKVLRTSWPSTTLTVARTVENALLHALWHYAEKPIHLGILSMPLSTAKLFPIRIENDINACLTCGICYERCPSDVNFPEFIRDMRCNTVLTGVTGRSSSSWRFFSIYHASHGLSGFKAEPMA
jgi:heterodisulfide reductase subunit D